MGEHDNTIAGGVGFWLFGESLGDSGDILRVRMAARAGPSLGFGLVADEVVDVGEDLLELGTEELSDEGGRKVKDEDLGKSCT